MLNTTKINEIINGLTNLKKNAELALQEARAAHIRIKNLVERLDTIEHYVGIRNHQSVEKPQQPYHFRQIKHDINTTKPPKSLTYKKS